MTESASLYRRHRPGSFDEVVGQQHVVRTLRNAVESDRVHHAYLFIGSRGTGKTSMAKILARSLNCVNGPTVTPCGECESCLAIAAGTSMDVIEMDAASNRSVDDVRDLRERVAYVPAAGTWKVYILDEAHMLTKEAWNAFLKTLEEPPPNTVFVLATTEAHKVMPTIADRCQRFDFQRPSLEQIAEVVDRVAAAEGIEIDDGAVAMLSRAASGSFRDALATLDQLVAFGGEKVELDTVLELLGAADADLLFAAVDAVAAEDPKGVLGSVDKLAGSGRDPAQFARDLLSHLRHVLVIQTTGEVPDSFVVTASDPDRLRAQAAEIGAATLVRTIDELAASLTAIREGDDARMAVELALLKAARPDLDPAADGLVRRVERLEQRIEGGAPAPRPTAEPPSGASEVPGASETPGATEAPPEQRATSNEQRDDEAPEAAEEPAAKQMAGDPIDLDRVLRVWPAVIDQVRQSGSAMLSALFEGARPVGVDSEESTLRIGFPSSATFNKRKAEAAEHRERFAEAVRTIVGERLRPVYVLLDGDTEVEEPAEEQLDEDALLERIKSEFDAEEVSSEGASGQ
ncbi:MAG: DNA polymerase III subunit gamma/tau [Actinomycetota bacterium]